MRDAVSEHERPVSTSCCFRFFSADALRTDIPTENSDKQLNLTEIPKVSLRKDNLQAIGPEDKKGLVGIAALWGHTEEQCTNAKEKTALLVLIGFVSGIVLGVTIIAKATIAGTVIGAAAGFGIGAVAGAIAGFIVGFIIASACKKYTSADAAKKKAATNAIKVEEEEDAAKKKAAADAIKVEEEVSRKVTCNATAEEVSRAQGEIQEALEALEDRWVGPATLTEGTLHAHDAYTQLLDQREALSHLEPAQSISEGSAGVSLNHSPTYTK